jgi:hypothetical protein
MLLEIDLREDLGLTIDLPPDAKEAIGEDIISTIKDRTQRGKPLGTASKFKKYSEKYAQRKGVDVSDVDLTLTEDMLNSLDVLAVSGNSIVIGFDDDSVIPRAFNHHTGDTLPKRPFFGIQKNELNEIKRANKQTFERARQRTRGQVIAEREVRDFEQEAIDSLVDQLMGGLIRFG